MAYDVHSGRADEQKKGLDQSQNILLYPATVTGYNIDNRLSHTKLVQTLLYEPDSAHQHRGELVVNPANHYCLK